MNALSPIATQPGVAWPGLAYSSAEFGPKVKGGSLGANCGSLQFAERLSEAKPFTGNLPEKCSTAVGWAVVCPSNRLPSGELAFAFIGDHHAKN